MIIPHSQLSPVTLQLLIEEFVTRDGTDYGATEVPLDTRVAQVMRQIERREVLICFDPDTESCTLLAREQLPADFLAAEMQHSDGL
jgi:uncharacterized protein YheU (UPF0270 family)